MTLVVEPQSAPTSNLVMPHAEVDPALFLAVGGRFALLLINAIPVVLTIVTSLCTIPVNDGGETLFGWFLKLGRRVKVAPLRASTRRQV